MGNFCGKNYSNKDYYDTHFCNEGKSSTNLFVQIPSIPISPHYRNRSIFLLIWFSLAFILTKNVIKSAFHSISRYRVSEKLTTFVNKQLTTFQKSKQTFQKNVNKHFGFYFAGKISERTTGKVPKVIHQSNSRPKSEGKKFEFSIFQFFKNLKFKFVKTKVPLLHQELLQVTIMLK